MIFFDDTYTVFFISEPVSNNLIEKFQSCIYLPKEACNAWKKLTL